MKKVRVDVKEMMIRNFNSLEEHARKTVQMHSLARHLAMKFKSAVPEDFGDSFAFTKLYFGKYQDGNESIIVTVEKFLEGDYSQNGSTMMVK